MKAYIIIVIIGLKYTLNAQSCTHYNSEITPNYCCGHDPEIKTQDDNHRLLVNAQGGQNFCDNSNYTLENKTEALPNDLVIVKLPCDATNTFEANEKFTSPIDTIKKWQFGINVGGGALFFVNKMPLYKNKGSYGYFIGLNAQHTFEKHKKLAYFLQVDVGQRVYNVNVPNLNFTNLENPFNFIGINAIEKFSRKNIQINYFCTSITHYINKRYKKIIFGLGLRNNFIYTLNAHSINENYDYKYLTTKITGQKEYEVISNKISYSNRAMTINFDGFIEYKHKENNSFKINIGLPIIFMTSDYLINWKDSSIVHANSSGTIVDLSSIPWSNSLVSFSYNLYFN